MTNLIENTGTGSIEHSGTGSIEHTGTGSIEHTGTGSIEHSGTGSIERSGSGRIVRRLALSVALACVFSGAAIADTASYATSHGTIDVHSSGNEVRISWHYDDGVNRQFLVGAGNVDAAYSTIMLMPVAAFKIETDGSTAAGSAYQPAGNSRGAHGQPAPEMGAPANFQKIETDGSTAAGSAYQPAGNSRGAHGQPAPEMGAPANFQKIETDGSTAAGSAYQPAGNSRGAHGQPASEMGAPVNFQKIETDGSTSSSIGQAWGGEMELIFTEMGIEAVLTRENAYAERESIVLDLNNGSDFTQAVVFVEPRAL